MSLTPREIQVIAHVSDGNTQSSISTLLGITSDTVNAHLDNIREKLGARNTPHAVAIAFKQKILS